MLWILAEKKPQNKQTLKVFATICISASAFLLQLLQTATDGTFSPQFVSVHAPEHGLDIDDGLGVCHVVLLSAHCALLIHNHQVVCVDDAALQEVVQAVKICIDPI